MIRLTSIEPRIPSGDKHVIEIAPSSGVGCGDLKTTTGNQPPPLLQTGSGNATPPPNDKPQYLIKWNRFGDQVCNAFAELFYSDEFADVTLSSEGEILRAHQVVLGLSSPFFRRIFQATPCKHPVVIVKGIAPKTLRGILEYVYLGEVVLHKDEINDFMDAADYLSIGGALANHYSCDISAISTVHDSTEGREGNPGESESPIFRFQGVKSRWHRRYNTSTLYHGTPTIPTMSSHANADKYKRSACTGEMDTNSTVTRNSAPETGVAKIDESLVPVEAPRDVQMGPGSDESIKDQMSSSIEKVDSPEISTTRKSVEGTFYQRQEYSNFEQFEKAKAQWEDWRNKGHPGVAKYHQSSLSSSQTHPPLAAFSYGSTFSDQLDRSKVNRHSGLNYPNTQPESTATYRDESDLYNRKSLDSTSKGAYVHHHRHMQGHNFSDLQHPPHRPQISLLSTFQAWQFQDAHHRRHEKSFPASSQFSLGLGSASSSSLTSASGFAAVSSSMNVTRPKTKAIRSSQVPQSSRYTAAEVDEMVDAVAHIPGNIVPCALCQKYVKRERLRSHIHECHLLTGEKIICPHCGIALKSKGSYRVHIWRHKRGDLPIPRGMSMPAFRVNYPSQ